MQQCARNSQRSIDKRMFRESWHRTHERPRWKDRSTSKSFSPQNLSRPPRSCIATFAEQTKSSDTPPFLGARDRQIYHAEMYVSRWTLETEVWIIGWRHVTRMRNKTIDWLRPHAKGKSGGMRHARKRATTQRLVSGIRYQIERHVTEAEACIVSLILRACSIRLDRIHILVKKGEHARS